MHTITFYRQGRRDGGIRTGIEVEGGIALGRFEEGGDDDDPVLTWFLIVECRGDGLPTETEAARRWLIDHAGPIKTALRSLADMLDVGMDIDSWPFLQVAHDRIDGEDVEIETRCAAHRRDEAHRIGGIIREVLDRWEIRVRSLPAVEEVRL